MNNLITLRSSIDRSINFIERINEKQAFECRYVKRNDDYFIAYLSSQSGCSQGCRMCHLTATGQTIPTNAGHDDLLRQLRAVLNHASNEDGKRPRTCHVNFMARGEPLANPFIDCHQLSNLGKAIIARGLLPKFLISTIMPRNRSSWNDRSLSERFTLVQPEIYYSLYSTERTFRERWLPAAVPVEVALRELKDWQNFSQKTIRIHHALIGGQNDSVDETKKICDLINEIGLHVHVNLVQYNPPNDESFSPSDERYELIAATFRSHLARSSTIRIIPRVGFDVKASCGMFV